MPRMLGSPIRVKEPQADPNPIHLVNSDPPNMTPSVFFQTLRDRPGMIMRSGKHPLHRLEAFIQGVRWHQWFSSQDDMASALLLLTNLPAHIAGVDVETGNSLGWFDSLLERNDYDEQRAFTEAMNILISIATE